MPDPVLAVSHVSKRYGLVAAVSDVSASFYAGEIHAVLGENGAGKSTLVGILSGFVLPDSGELILRGKPLSLGNPAAMRRSGIEMVHQHFTLVPEFTVEENLALGRLQGLFRSARPELLSRVPLSVANKLGWELEPKARIATLPVGAQQRIEIIKAISSNADILIFDEPTAVLSLGEIDDFITVLKDLSDSGKTVILIAHKLSEVLRVADRVSVLRKGKWVASELIGEVTEDILATWMVGEMPPLLQEKAPSGSGIVLAVKQLCVRGDRGNTAVDGISFEVASGEVLGVGGVDGNGQVELAEALAQVRPMMEGEIVLNPPSLRIGYIPPDRQAQGLALGMSVSDNLLIVGYRKPDLSIGPILRLKKVREWAEGLVSRFRIAVQDIREPAGILSGGNQQKVVVARALESAPGLLVAVNPARGLDIQATQYVHTQILAARAAGAAVVLLSSDLEELGSLADRTVFMSKGKFVEGTDAVALVGGRS